MHKLLFELVFFSPRPIESPAAAAVDRRRQPDHVLLVVVVGRGGRRRRRGGLAVEVVVPERLLERDPERGVVVEHARDEVVHGHLAVSIRGGLLLGGGGAAVLMERPAVLVRVAGLGSVSDGRNRTHKCSLLVS